MDIVVLTRDQDEYELDMYLRERGYLSMVCDEIDSLLSLVDSGPVDFILCDFRFFGLKSRNPYETLKNCLGQRRVPFVFYNDPFPEFTKEDILRQFRGTVREFHSPRISQQENQFLECLAIGVYRYVYTERYREPEDTETLWLEKLKKILRIPKSKFALLKLFFERRGEVWDARDLCSSLWNRDDFHAMANIYAYIAFLRKRFLDFPKLELKIENVKKGKYVFDFDSQALDEHLFDEDESCDYWNGDSENQDYC